MGKGLQMPPPWAMAQSRKTAPATGLRRQSLLDFPSQNKSESHQEETSDKHSTKQLAHPLLKHEFTEDTG